jgi:hypothetical protein
MALTVGATASAIALAGGVLRAICAQLAHDPMVVRALAVTYLAAGFMLGRVAIRCSAGLRRAAALVVAALFAFPALILAVRPELAAQLYDQGKGLWAPWALGLPGIAALFLSRWRVS